MIDVSTQPDFGGLVNALESEAKALAEARAAAAALKRSAPGEHWRRATLLWPQFSKG